MDKATWLDRFAPLASALLDKHSTGNRLEASFGSLINKQFIGRAAFQNIYDLVSSWACWDLLKQEAEWQTKVIFEVQSSQVIGGDSPHTRWFVETDEQCVNVSCYCVLQKPSSHIDMTLKGAQDKNQLSTVTARHVIVDDTLFKMVPNATFSDVVVVKRKVFEVDNYFHWKYEFTLTWASPFIDEKEGPAFVFKQEPKCEFKITCEPLAGITEKCSVDYIAESFLYRVHEAVPSFYRSSDGTSVSLSSARDG